jgi:shikimate dehydrogenase
MAAWSDRWRPGGSTRLAAVIGDPVRHSLSPAIFNDAFAAVGLDWVFVALPVADGEAVAALAGMRALQIDGLSVTMPHKTAVADAVDELTDDARRLRAVNHVTLRDGRLVGDNTDGGGFLAALRADLGFDPAGTRCAVVGAGGAARAVVLALGRAGAAEVNVVNRTAERAVAAAALAGSVGRVGDPTTIATADLVVNATSVGMGDDGAVPFDPSLLADGQVVADLVYRPLVTPLLAAAEARGIRATNGLGMLVHQAAAQFEDWTGVPAPIDVMLAAVRRAL